MTAPPGPSAKTPPQPTPSAVRRLPIGAEVQPGGGVHFRTWAPKRRRVEVVCDGGLSVVLAPDDTGYFAGLVPGIGAGTRYRYRLDGGPSFPDPASRFQPEGPHGPSEVVDPAAFSWTDTGWAGVRLKGQVLYEMHIGTFTPDGTWRAASAQLPRLADLGITVLEVMPVAEFPGLFGWGYDGVDLFAPYHVYGSPDDFRRFVDQAHGLGLGVILDVVYNHLGPDGCFVREYSDDYFSPKYETDWGDPLNFDGEHAGPVREFILSNAASWIDEYHLDGLRLDATQNIYDTSGDHILAALARTVRQVASGRATILINENEPQHTWLVRPASQGGYGLDGLWNDDFHHSAIVALTGHREAYYTDYNGTAAELLATVKWGYLYQGQHYQWQDKRRGTPAIGLPPEAFVAFLENHDQLANSGTGERIHALTSPGRYRALTALLLLSPGTPMLFQGQEFAASSPFLYFADHKPDLARQVARGRAEFVAQFPTLATDQMQARLADPADRATFMRCKLDAAERQDNGQALALHRDLLRLRRTDAVLSAQRAGGVDGAALSETLLLLRYFGSDGDDRLLLVNLGKDWYYRPAPEPLLAPPLHTFWRVLWSSEDPTYGGHGTPPIDSESGWFFPGESAVVLTPRPLTVEEQQAEAARFGPTLRKGAADKAAHKGAIPGCSR